jgi:hypothetical protein
MNNDQNNRDNDSAGGEGTSTATTAAAAPASTRETRTAARRAARASAPRGEKGESHAQRDARNQAAGMAKQNADSDVKAIRADLAEQSEAVKDFDPTRQVARREFGANGAPQSNPRVRDRSAR